MSGEEVSVSVGMLIGLMLCGDLKFYASYGWRMWQ